MKQAQHLSGDYCHPTVRLPKKQVPYAPTNCHHPTIHHQPYIKFNIPTKLDTWRPVARQRWSSTIRQEYTSNKILLNLSRTSTSDKLVKLDYKTTRLRGEMNSSSHRGTRWSPQVPHQPYLRTELHYKYRLGRIDDKSNHMRVALIIDLLLAPQSPRTRHQNGLITLE